MDVGKDYYALLGVLPSVDTSVLQAVYRVLVKKYHPDTGNDPDGKGSAFIEIQQAYEILRDPVRRATYDKLRAEQKEQTGRYDQATEDSATRSEAREVADEAWDIVREYEPIVADIERGLDRISPSLSLLFRTIMLTERDFKSAPRIGRQLEGEFLSTYFGDSTEIQDFARRLLAPGRGRVCRDAARELNRVIRALRNPSDPGAVIERISDKFGLYNAGAPPPGSLPNSAAGWRTVIAAAEAQGWRYTGLFSPKFLNETTGKIVAAKSPEAAWVQMGLDNG
jgi:curved DNA-binding protein CbpA